MFPHTQNTLLSTQKVDFDMANNIISLENSKDALIRSNELSKITVLLLSSSQSRTLQNSNNPPLILRFFDLYTSRTFSHTSVSVLGFFYLQAGTPTQLSFTYV